MKKVILSAIVLGTMFAGNISAQSWNFSGTGTSTKTGLGSTLTGSNIHGQIHLPAMTDNRQIIFNETANNAHQFAGFGYNNSMLRYQLPSTSASHVFYAGSSSSSSNELLRIKGNGNVGINNSSPTERLDIVGNFKLSNNLNIGVSSNLNAGFNSVINLGNSVATSYPQTDTVNSHKAQLGIRNGFGFYTAFMNNHNGFWGIFNPDNQRLEFLYKEGSGITADETKTKYGSLCLYNNGNVRISNSGNLAIGNGTGEFGEKLMVFGNAKISNKLIVGDVPPTSDFSIYAKDGVLAGKLKIADPTNSSEWQWPDFVFAKDHKLSSLDSLELFINKNSHLPDVPSADEISKNGIDVAKMDAALLRKIEEMTLYLIDMNKKLGKVEIENENLRREIESLKK